MKKIILLILFPLGLFAQKTDSTLAVEVNVIKNEVNPAANSKTRVGNTLQDIVDTKISGESWITNHTYYANKSFVINSSTLYKCLVNHKSATFSTDLSGGKWVSISGTGGGGGGTPGGINTQMQYNNSSAFAGTSGATATATTVTLNSPVINTPTGLSKTDVGLSNVDNTSDANKPVSVAQTTALGLKDAVLSPVAVKTSAYTAGANEFVPCNTTSGSFIVTLPTAPSDKTRIGVKIVIQSSTNSVTIAAGGSDVFNKAGGSTTYALSFVNQGVLLQYNASAGIWYVQADNLPLSSLDTRYGYGIGTAGYVWTSGGSGVQPSYQPLTISAPAYATLTDAASINIDATSSARTNKEWTSSRTAVTLTWSNLVAGSSGNINFFKTNNLDLTLTLPSGTIIINEGVPANGSLTTTLTSTTSGNFSLYWEKVGAGAEMYFFVKRILD